NSELLRRVIKIAALVEKLNIFRAREKAMGEPDGNVNLILLFGREEDGSGFAEVRGADPKIHDCIEGFPYHNAAELCLRMLQLLLQAAQNPFRRARLIILDEIVCDAEFSELCLVVGLQEETAGIAENLGAQFEDAREGCFLSLHENQGLSRFVRSNCAPIRK